MSYISVSRTVSVLLLVTLVEKTHLTTHDNSHGFVSTSRESYFVDDLSSIHQDISSGFRSSIMNDMKMFLKFEPEFLDFKQRALGIPHLEKVMLFNVNSNKSIDMTSISGSTVHFHSSFFEDKQIPPLGNTSFNVVFLGREEGVVESNLFIHTTEGHFKYHVKGASVSSPYRLRPITNVKLPVNATFSPLIYMYNPYREPIQIIEIYSSGGDFHLELPSGELEGPKDMWEIPPLQTKAIIRIRFYAKTEQNHTAYVRIKLNNSDDILVVPLEVEVTSSSSSLHHPQGFVDFGVGGTLDLEKKVELQVNNPLKKAIRIQSITTTSKAIKVEFDTVKIPPDSSAKIGMLTLDWKKAFEERDFSGKIVIKYKNGKQKTEIPFYVTILEGGLLLNKSETTFFIDSNTNEQLPKDVIVTNEFAMPVAVTEVTLHLNAQKIFSISNFKPTVIKPKEQKVLFNLNLVDKNATNLKMNSQILIKTNISNVEVPLMCYNGRLDVVSTNKNGDKTLDLGLLGLETSKDMQLVLYNNNPIDIHFKWIDSSLALSKLEIVACGKGNYSNLLLQNFQQPKKKCNYLKPEEFAVLKLTVHTSGSEGRLWGDIQVETDYEEISIPVMCKVAQGKLEIGPDRLVFDQCFPGKICSHPLRVHSTFNDLMVIEEITSIPPDPRVSSIHSGHIMPRSNKIIGHLYLDPMQTCKNECYCKLKDDANELWLQSLNLTGSTADQDLGLVNILYNRYLNETSNGMIEWQNLTMTLETSEVKGHIFQTRVKMSWPSLIVAQHIAENFSSFDFPLTQVGNISYQNITIRNPANHSLVVQLLVDYVYPDAAVLYEGLPPSFIPNYMPDYVQSAPVFFFNEDFKQHQSNFKTVLNVDVHKDTLPVLLKPGQNFTFSVGYLAKDANINTALMFIRNNLTVLEVIRLNGKGAYPSFKFGNRKPGSNQPLAFEITEKHLKDCEREHQKKYPPPNLTVKRTFTARNTGDVTIYINSFSINGYPCEGYGFKILNCEPVLLAPNSTKKIDIAFTSDFSLARVTRMLILETSLNYPINYTLLTTVPPYYLSLCSKVLVRPPWETYLYYTAVCLMCFMLFFVVVTPVLESERIIKQSLGVIVSRNGTSLQPLDLRLVGAQTRNELHSSKAADSQKNKEHKLSPKVVSDVHFADDKIEKEEPHRYKQSEIPVKKKRCKKNISEEEVKEQEAVKKNWPELHKQQKHKSNGGEHRIQSKCDSVEGATSISVKKSPTQKDNKHKWPLNKKSCHLKQPQPEMFEEETSSTTTDSSNNDEADKTDLEKEPEKEVEKSLKNCNNKKYTNCSTPPPQPPQKPIVPNVDNYENKLEKKKQKQAHKSKDKNEKSHEMLRINHENKPKGHKSNSKERKEKQTLCKKLSSEKHARNTNESSSNSRTSTSPSVGFISNSGTNVSGSGSIWGENRATFSDVVARSENVSPNVQPRPSLGHPQTSKPTMYVEPYVPATTNLGPIGSKKTSDYNQQLNNPLSRLNTMLEQQYFNGGGSNYSNSFFSDSHSNANGAGDYTDGFLNCWAGETYEQRNSSSLMSLMQSDSFCTGSSPGTQGNQDLWTGTNVGSMWDSVYTPLGGALQSQQLVNHQSGYLWGSSSVWQPLGTTETPRPSTRTPPGFAPNTDERRNQMYDLFGLTSIWSQQQVNPWNYPQSQ